jgi:hypothetical protein
MTVVGKLSELVMGMVLIGLRLLVLEGWSLQLLLLARFRSSLLLTLIAGLLDLRGRGWLSDVFSCAPSLVEGVLLLLAVFPSRSDCWLVFREDLADCGFEVEG